MKKNYKRLLALAPSAFLTVLLKAQIITFTFTSAGASGPQGPSQAQINAAYLSTNLNGSVTSNAGIQSFTVPTAGLYHIDVSGASGGSASSYFMTGGLGARMQGLFNLNAGQVLQILVGQSGGDGCGDGGGGGGSYVVNTGTLLIAAGGGGGCTSQINGVNATTLTSGTQDNPVVSNGGTAGSGGASCASGSHNGGGGGGYNAGAGGNGANGGGGGGGGLSFLNGGTGGAGFFNTQQGPAGGFGGGGGGSYCTVGGGGGGGYSGGAGGQHLNQCISNSFRTGGGGGGSFNSAASQTNAVAFQTGNGRVLITRLCYITLGTSTGVNAVCLGAGVTLTTNAISNYSWSTGSSASAITVSPGVTTTYSLTATSPSNCVASAAITITVSNVVPSVSLTASTNSLCLGNTVSIVASGALTYTFSGGVTNGVPFIPFATTAYTVLGQNGCGTASAVTNITVSALPITAITSTNVVCAGGSATLNAGGANTYSWQPGGLTGATVLVSPFVSTTYTVIGTIGQCGGISTVAILANPNPTVVTTVSHFTLCAGESSTLTASGALSYTWTPGGVGSSIVVSPIIPTAYNVVGVNSFGCLSNTNQPVIAYAGPNMNIAASSTLICSGSPVTLNANGATTYNWSNGATTAVTTATPSSTTIYTVVGSSPNTICNTTKTIEITVVTATIAVSNPTAICLGESTTLNASGASTYNWSNGGSGSSINVNPVSSTVYTVTGISSMGSGTCASSATTQVTVNQLPTVIAASTRTNICRNETANITVSGASTYSWSTGSTATAVAVSPTLQTTYTVIGTDANGCKNTGSIIIKVFSCVGLDENSIAANSITIYPNPSSGEFNISSGENMSLLLINELGQLIIELELNAENAYTAEVKGLSKGIYFITSKETNQVFSKKIVVQ